MTEEENLSRLQSELWRYESIFKATEKKYLEIKENYEGLKANYKKAYEEFHKDPSNISRGLIFDKPEEL